MCVCSRQYAAVRTRMCFEPTDGGQQSGRFQFGGRVQVRVRLVVGFRVQGSRPYKRTENERKSM